MRGDDSAFDPAAFLSETALNESQRSFDLKVLADQLLEADALKRFKEIRKVEARIASLEKSIGATELELKRYPMIFFTEAETSFHEMEISSSWRAWTRSLFTIGRADKELKDRLATQLRYHEELLIMFAKFQRLTRLEWIDLGETYFLEMITTGEIDPMDTRVEISQAIPQSKFIDIGSELFDLYISYYQETLAEAIDQVNLEIVYSLCYTIKLMDALRYSLQLKGYPSEFSNEEYKLVQFRARRWAEEIGK